MTEKLFIFAGEKSGDMLGRHLLSSLKKQMPDTHFYGVGGPEMRSEDLECVMHTEEFEVIGFADIVLSFPKIAKQFYFIRNEILNSKPDGVILIDYPGFNLRLAKALRDKGYQGKIVQYISPTVWAWGKSRIQKMSDTLDLLICIYPFEETFWQEHPLDVKYVGNPVKEIVKNHQYQEDWQKLFGIPKTENLISLFPGSRKSEIQKHLPLMLSAAEKLKEKYPDAVFGVSCAHEEIIPVMQQMLNKHSLKINQDIFLLPKTFAYELMRDSRSAIAKSGTVTLELALHQRPTVVIYYVSWFNWFVAKYGLRLNLPFYCIVNILKQSQVFPELIENGLSAENIVKELIPLHEESPAREACIAQCKELDEHLLERETGQHAAKEITELVT